MKTTLKGMIFLPLPVVLFLVLSHVPVAGAVDPPEEDDINPHFVAKVGTPGGGETVAWSVFGGSPPNPPHKVAVGETVHCTDHSWDKDELADGDDNYVTDPINQRWWYVGASEEKYTSEQEDKTFDWLIEAAGEFIIRQKVEDDSPVVSKNDTVLTDSSAKFYTLALEYITLTPGYGGSIEGDEIVIDISTNAIIDGTGYNYTYTGDGRDGERCYDNLGRPIPGYPLDDIQLSAAYDWSFSGPMLLAALDPAQDCTWTKLYPYGLTGRGTLTATYTKQEPNVSGSARVKFVNGDYFIDLTGINYDEVQNVPINGKAPASCDGTGSVGEMKAKVVIEGEANTTYDIVVSEDCFDLSIPDPDFSITTDGQGQGEAEIHLCALSGAEPTEYVEITAEMQPDGGGDPLASTEEHVMLYKFFFPGLGDCTWDDDQPSTNGFADVGDFKAGAKTVVGGMTEFGRLEEHFDMRVRCDPEGAFSGTVNARARITFRVNGCWKLTKGFYENDGTVGVSITAYFLTASVSASGPDDVALLAGDWAVKMPSHSDWQQYASGLTSAFEKNTTEFTVMYPPMTWESREDSFLQDHPVNDGQQRTYSVGNSTQTHTVELKLDFDVRTTDPWIPDTGQGCTAEGSLRGMTGDTSVSSILEEKDGVYEIVTAD